jgi:Na+/H+-dicarboxylate symporter
MTQATTPTSGAPPAKPSNGLISGFGWQVLAGMVAGVCLGLLTQSLGGAEGEQGYWLAETLRIIGATFVQFLKAIVPPLVLTAVIASIANLRELQNAAGLVWRTLLWFGITALIAVLIGISLGLLIQPGVHATVVEGAAARPDTTGSWLDFLTGLAPSNFLGLEASTELVDGAPSTTISFNVLQIVVVGIVLGFAAVRAGPAAEPFLAFNAAALAVVRKVLWWIIRLTPIGTIGLLGNAVAHYGWNTLGQLGWFAAAVYIGLGIVLLLVYPALLLLNGLDPVRFFEGVWPAMQLGFVSRSSIGTLPVTQTVTEDRLGVPKAYAAFAVPLGATTKMDGCAAIYPAISAIFVAQFFHLDLQVTDYVLIVLVSVLGSAATAGVTGATVMLTLTLSTLGLPLEGAGLLLAIDPILDMGRTAVNVVGQALVPTIVAKRQRLLDQGVFDARSGGVEGPLPATPAP